MRSDKVTIIHSFIYSNKTYTHILQGFFTGTEAIVPMD